MARVAAQQPTLGKRHLLVRVVHDMDTPDTPPLQLAPDECLRVLFVFADSEADSQVSLLSPARRCGPVASSYRALA